MAEEKDPSAPPDGAPTEANEFSYLDLDFPQLTKEQFAALPVEVHDALRGPYDAITQFADNIPQGLDKD